MADPFAGLEEYLAHRAGNFRRQFNALPCAQAADGGQAFLPGLLLGERHGD